MAAMATSDAGSRRRARRTQNDRRSTRPLLACSITRREVMRKPDRVKNVETARKAPDAKPMSAWTTKMASRARARRPSMPGW